MTLRILGGTYKSRMLKAPTTQLSKPTMSLMKKSLFDIIQTDIDGARFLDVFACSGSIGLEAISRGAISATFIENNRKAVACIQENISSLGVQEQCRILCASALTALKELEKNRETFTLIYLDPPYTHAEQKDCSPYALLTFFDESDLLETGGKLFFEEGGSSAWLQTMQLHTLQHVNTRKFSTSYLHQFIKAAQKHSL